ncbi:MAG: peptidylprolyl isomerase [Myxococcota bacterium]
MLRILRSGQRWLIWFVVIGIGGVFVFFLGLQGPLQGSAGGTVVAVGPHRFGIREFERVRARQTANLEQRLGDEFAARALGPTLDQMAARELVDRALLAMEAEDFGLSVSKEEVQQLVLSDPGFRDESGRFDPEIFEDYVEYEYGSQSAFIQEQQMALLSRKMIRLLIEQPRVSEGEARDALTRQLEQIRIAFVVLGEDEADPESIADEDVAAALTAREGEIRALYDARDAEFNLGEAVRARHILFAVDAEGGEEAEREARGRAAQALARLADGEDFAALATELTDDAGTKQSGGDLGFFERGQMVKPFEDAAFALEPGVLSEPVQSVFGFHLIRVEERRDAVHRPFEEVREQLARELIAGEVALARAREQADALSAAIRDGRSLEEAAREKELTLERSGLLSRRGDGFVPGLGAIPELLATAFALEPGESSPRVFETDRVIALVQTLERVPADEKVVAERLEAVREQLLESKRNARADRWVNARREQLVAAGELDVEIP